MIMITIMMMNKGLTPFDHLWQVCKIGSIIWQFAVPTPRFENIWLAFSPLVGHAISLVQNSLCQSLQSLLSLNSLWEKAEFWNDVVGTNGQCGKVRSLKVVYSYQTSHQPRLAIWSRIASLKKIDQNKSKSLKLPQTLIAVLSAIWN